MTGDIFGLKREGGSCSDELDEKSDPITTSSVLEAGVA